jgi:hypothetical protein
MSQFNSLKQFDISSDTVMKFELVDIQMGGKTPYLMVKPATEANKPYTRAQLKSSNKRIQRAAAKGISLETLEANRDDDRSQYPRHIITDWGNVFDDNGDPVPYSVANCTEFMEALPNWVFDGLRSFCSQPTNFADTVDEDELGN